MNPNPPVTRKDRSDLSATITVAVLAAVGTVYIAVMHLLELFAENGITARTRFDGLPAELPIGPDGSAVAGRVHEASITFTDVPTISVISLTAAIIATGLAFLVVIGCILRFCLNLMRGTAFTRENTRLITATGVAILAGATLELIFTTMGLNGAFASLGDGAMQPENAITTNYWVALFAAITLGAVGVAFRAGERLQRDTEGLV